MPSRKTFLWLLAALVLYLIAWNIGSGWLYVLTAMLAAFPLASLFMGRANIRGLDAHMSTGGSACAGDSLTTTIEFANRSRLPRFFISIECSYGGSRESLFVPRIGGRSTKQLEMTFAGLKRGLYGGAELRLGSGAPMGLTRSRRNIHCQGPLAVYPSWSRLGNDWSAGQWDLGHVASSSLPSRSASSDYLGVRDYRSDDSPRSIHWRSTARRGSLSVVEYSRQSVVLPVFLLDTFSGDGRPTPEPVFEAMVSTVASLVQRETANNRRFAIGRDPEAAAGFKLTRESEAAMFWLAGVEAGADRPMELEDHLPWPEATPVLIIASHREYGDLYERALLAAHPHAAVIVFDARAAAADARDGAITGHTPAARGFMDDSALAALESGLEAIGSRMLLVNEPEELAQCLHFL